MREIDKYNVLKEKLQGICEENNLTYSIQNKKYPFILTIKPLGGLDAQQTMIEGMDNPGDTGYISPDARLVMTCRDGDPIYRTSETFTISANLFNKFKNIFSKMYAMWTQYFFRDITENGGAPTADTAIAEQTEEKAEPEGEDTADPFKDFMDDPEPAEDTEDLEETEDETPDESGDDE